MTHELKQKKPLSIAGEPHIDAKGHVIPDKITSYAERTAFSPEHFRSLMVLASYGVDVKTACPITGSLAKTVQNTPVAKEIKTQYLTNIADDAQQAREELKKEKTAKKLGSRFHPAA